MDKTQEQVNNEGWNANRENEYSSKNPYPDNTPEHEWWLDGWLLSEDFHHTNYE